MIAGHTSKFRRGISWLVVENSLLVWATLSNEFIWRPLELTQSSGFSTTIGQESLGGGLMNMVWKFILKHLDMSINKTTSCQWLLFRLNLFIDANWKDDVHPFWDLTTVSEKKYFLVALYWRTTRNDWDKTINRRPEESL